MRRRTDAERRASLELMNLQHAADKLARERDDLRLQLAGIVRAIGGRGWHDPRAAELSERVRQVHSEWEHVIERVREAKTALWALKKEMVG